MTIMLKLGFKTPTLPNFITVVGLKRPTLDEAIAKGEEFTIGVGELDEDAVEQVIAQWSENFRLHCAGKRNAT